MIRVVVGLAIAATYILMVMGNVVTTSGSGLACPDWPLCHGAVIPPAPYNNWIEMGHRLMASFTGTLVLLSTILIWLKIKGSVTRWFTLIALILTGVVAGLGAFVVLSEAPNLESLFDVLLISTHIILAATIFTLMILTFRMLPQSPGEKVEKFYLLMLGFVVAQVLLGILVRYGQASLACPDFPYCKGVWVPDFIDLKITLQFIHRLNALIIFTISLVYMIDCLRKGHDQVNASVTFLFILAQATIGAYIVWSSMYFPYVVLHGANGFALYGWLVFRAAPYFRKDLQTEGT
ncbi:MAG: COX15/CtaA family protein [Nitrospinota bacterium]|nr:COX15/CtaA family protein [Nitrospinota bacterium]MDH5755363.1 COX15/CtaA family protein [Nitrospinota bacterium]